MDEVNPNDLSEMWRKFVTGRQHEQFEQDVQQRVRELLKDLVDVLLALDRIVSGGGEDHCRLVRNDLETALERFGVREIECAGSLFNPEVHRAVERCHQLATPRGTIIDVVSRGFTWGGDVVVAPRVVVACDDGGGEDSHD
ncbi:MAG: nucleotide exchange factor GrpE [Planctomycetes bacterium]|nr:nucleotide exchange factor GrpE [Planctomycetota bacterium]